MRKTILRKFKTLLLAIVFSASSLTGGAQQGDTTTYVYDDNGRLHAVISPSGEAAVYEYDAAGNIIAIRRLATGDLVILSFSPQEGLPGDQVTFLGVGFGAGVSDVSFNGASAAVVSVTAAKVVATVPQAATTGPVTITTPGGSVATATPFTVVGLRITPSFAALKFGESVQFVLTAVPPTLGQTVQWSVDGINGGSTSVGTISATGVYTAPNSLFSSVTIRAESATAEARFAEAHVQVSDPDEAQSVFAVGVTVQRGEHAGTAAFAHGVGVRFDGGGTGPMAALASPLSIQYENSWGQYSALHSISATRGPNIQSITPNTLTRGSSLTVTIMGVGLTAASAIRFINANGTIDSTVTSSNIVVNADGTTLTATMSASTSAVAGSRIVIIVTPNGDSPGVDLIVNKINVQ